MAARPVILCPLQIERRAAARRVGGACNVVAAGPGGENIARVLKRLDPAPGALVILFGVAGGLRQTERAPAIAEALDLQTGERWRSPMASSGAGVTIVGVDQPIASPRAKRELSSRTGASLVDCESHAFARTCAERSLRWAIVRGVSDGPGESLPAGAMNWVDSSGRTRLGRVCLSCAGRPTVIGSLIRLGRGTKAALAAAGDRLAALVDADTIARS